MRVRTGIVLGLGVLALAAAGCGGSDSAAPAETATDETTFEETTDEAMTDEATTDESEEASTGEVDLGNLSDECLEFASIGAKIAQAMGTSGGNDIGASADYFQELADAAPDEIKDDLEVFSEEFAKFAKALSGVDLSAGETPSAEDLAKLQAATSAFDDPRIQEASDNIQAWAEENCTSS